MRIEVDDFPEQGFLAGRRNELSFWIGPRVESAHVAGSADAVPETGRTLHLDAHFEWPGGEAHAELTLNADPSTRSEPKFTVSVDIDAAATRFAGTLYFWVRETGRLYEQVEVAGVVADHSHTSQPRLVSIVEDRGQIERITATSLPMGGCLIHEGNTLSWYTGTRPVTFDASGFSTVLDGLASAVANLQARAGTVDWSDPTAVDLLRRLAIEGAKLRYAIAGTIEPGQAFQFFNHQGKSSMPLEWIYDRGHTAPDAELRAECVASLRDRAASARPVAAPFPCGCPPATALTSEVMFSNPVLCPWGFWGLAKIIERYDIEPAVRNNIVHPDGDQALPAISSVLLGANESLDRPSGRPGDEVIDLAARLADSVVTDRVYTWAELRAKVADGASNLIVTLPHQDQDSLQIGTDRLLLSQVPALLPEHLDGIILLLGCKTSQPASTGFASFARLFKDKAAVVIGSSATLVTTDAARMAIGLVDGLLEISRTDQPLGRAIVDARRTMFADGLPIALAVTAIGDADWRFAIERQPLVPA